MQKQVFMFNPMQIGSPRSAQHRNQHREEGTDGDFGPIGSNIRHQRLQGQNIRKENEPLLLPSTKKMQQLQDQETRPMKSGERLTNLHSQLYQHTEKLKQWKINTEIQISDKDRKITEASKTIESLRKSMLELQFLNESVSSKLQAEKTLQEETVQKIATTRNMCNALKEHLVKLENGVVAGENMLEKQREDTKLKVDQFEELAVKFQELEIKVIGKEHEMEKAVEAKQNEYAMKIEELQKEMKESEDTVVQLRQINDTQTEELAQKNQQIAMAKEEIEKAMNEMGVLQEQFNHTSAALQEYEVLLREEKNSNEKMRQENDDKEQGYMKHAANLESACKEREKEVRTVEKDLLDKSKALFKAEARITHLSEMIESKNLGMEELVAKLTELESIRSLQEANINELTSKTMALECKVLELDSLVEKGKETETEMSRALDGERDLSKKLREEMDLLEEEVDEGKKAKIELKNLDEKVQELEANKEELQFQAKFAISQVEEMTAQLQVLTKENEMRKEDAEAKSLELSKINVERLEGLRKLGEAETKINEQCKEICEKTEELKQWHMKFDEVCKDRDNDQGAQEELMGMKDNMIANTEAKVNALEDKVSGKAKQIGKLQAEVKALKAQMKKQEKLIEKQEKDLTTAQEQVINFGKEKNDAIEALQTRETGFMEEMNNFTIIASEKEKGRETAMTEMEKWKNQAELAIQQKDNAQQELKTAKQTFDAQITEMCSTLEKYKVENEKLMNAKEKELDMKTKGILESKKVLEEAIKTKDNEIKKSGDKVREQEEQICQLENEIQQMTSKISKMEMQVHGKFKSDVEMIDVGIKSEAVGANDVKRPDKGSKAVKSPRIQNSLSRRSLNTPQMSTPSSIPQGKLTIWMVEFTFFLISNDAI